MPRKLPAGRPERTAFTISELNLHWIGILLLCLNSLGTAMIRRGILHLDAGMSLEEASQVLDWSSGAAEWAVQATMLSMAASLAIPLYAKLLMEAVRQTENRRELLLTLGGCALISEVPYDWTMTGELVDAGMQNPAWGLLLGGDHADDLAAAETGVQADGHHVPGACGFWGGGMGTAAAGPHGRAPGTAVRAVLLRLQGEKGVDCHGGRCGADFVLFPGAPGAAAGPLVRQQIPGPLLGVLRAVYRAAGGFRRHGRHHGGQIEKPASPLLACAKYIAVAFPAAIYVRRTICGKRKHLYDTQKEERGSASLLSGCQKSPPQEFAVRRRQIQSNRFSRGVYVGKTLCAE